MKLEEIDDDATKPHQEKKKKMALEFLSSSFFGKVVLEFHVIHS